MTPYYSDDLVTIYHADARDWAQPVDVLITDPPYGVALAAKTTEQRHGQPSKPVSVMYADDPAEVRALVAEVIPRLIGLADRALIFPGVRMLWVYPEPASVGAVYVAAGTGRSAWGFQTHHPILFYGKDPYLADGKGSRPNGFRDERGLGRDETVNHPCPKPLAWMRWAVARASREGETVLDPFMGSGTTLMASKALGRRSIGIEIEERYCEIAATRCSQEVLGLVG
jgi:site-specific DNA-methyltransferase (adenine-specific)